MRPVVLAHGIARFDALLAAAGWNAYFKRIPSHLTAHGFEVRETRVPFAASVVDRSRALVREVDAILAETGSDRVHLIAHSMGGLDARRAIVDEGLAARVATLTTIGTPHRGTTFADVGLDGGGDHLVRLLGGDAGSLAGFRDLRTDACREFNARAEVAEAANDVRYAVVSSHQSVDRVFAPLRRSARLIEEREGANDGLVSVASQEWAEVLRGDGGREKVVRRSRFPFEADHLNELGWWDPSELAGVRWWQLWRHGLVQRASAYEEAVREVYLDLARGVTRDDP